ncbi:hypothetical protein C8R46DRAFT_892593 [Mycena filopes]|nr:hypothetical protein C8R46DRAFT_892593 [Mycena filopes]
MDPDQSFYDVLQVQRDATPEQIRKAYKKLALQTHPDRLPAGFSNADKQNAEERFRQVSNAYEVLKDPESRRLYDTHGVWPPPTPPPEQPYPPRHTHRGGPRPNHYEPFPDPFENFFSEPFELFDRIFSSYRRPSYHPVHRSSSNFNRDPFEAMYRMRDMMADLEREMFSSFPSRSLSLGFDPPPFGGRGQVRWVQQSSMMTTHNGVTHRIDKRRDSDGNEHVTRIYPDGREIYTVNGVEQQHYLPPPGPPPPPRDHRGMHPPPPQMNNPRGFIPPPPSYHSHSPRSSMHSGHDDRGRRPVFRPWDSGSSAIVPPNGYRRDRHTSGAHKPPAAYRPD